MVKKIETDYDALDSISAVRINTGMFIGDTETPNHLATEVVDNMLDEIANGFAKEGEIFINEEDGSFWVSDTGRGLKIGVSKDPDTGEMKDSIELLCTKLFSGSKFRIDNKVDYAVQIGMHGVGLVVVNALSEWLVIRVRKQTKIYEYIFMDSVFNSKDVFDQTDETFSTQIGFKPNPEYFDQVNFDIKMFVSRLLLTQCVYDNAKFKINDKKIPKISLYDYAKNTLDISKDNKLYQVSKNYGKNEKIRIFLNYFSERDSIVIGDVNLRTCDGTYIANLQTMIKDIISNNIDRKYRSLDDKEFLIGLRLYCSLTLEKPKFDAQIKSRMKTNIKKYLVQIEKDLTKILTQNDIMNTITSMLEQKMTKKIINNASNGKRISSTNKLRDCLQSPGDVLYIVEGDSADGTLKIVRNKKTEASFPLKGKVLNVEKGSLLKIEKNKEVQDLVEAIGPVGKRRYKKIKMLADSDFDGLHINLLTLLFLNKFALDMIENGQVSILMPPLYGAVKGKKFVPIYKIEDTKKYRDSGYEIRRFKGLGEMNSDQLEVAVRSGVEYVVKYPGKDVVDNIIENVVNNTEVRKKLLLKDVLSFDLILDQATQYAVKSKTK